MNYRFYNKKGEIIYSLSFNIIIFLFLIYNLISVLSSGLIFIILFLLSLLYTLIVLKQNLELLFTKKPAVLINKSGITIVNSWGIYTYLAWEKINKIVIFEINNILIKGPVIGFSIKNSSKVVYKKFGGLNKVITIKNVIFTKDELLKALNINELEILIEDYLN